MAAELELVGVASGQGCLVTLPNGHEIHSVTSVYRCLRWEGTPVADGDEGLAVGWIDPFEPDREVTPFLSSRLEDFVLGLNSTA